MSVSHVGDETADIFFAKIGQHKTDAKQPGGRSCVCVADGCAKNRTGSSGTGGRVGARERGARGLVERFNIEPFSDFSAK